MDKRKIQEEFEQALIPNRENGFTIVISKLVCGLLFVIGMLTLMAGFSNITSLGSRATPMDAIIAYSGLTSGLLILALACIVGLLITLVEDNRALKKLVRRVSAGVVKSRAQPSSTVDDQRRAA